MAKKLVTAKKFGDRLRTHRKCAARTLAQDAERLKVSVSIISQWERGLRYPSVRNLHKLSKHLGISIENLMYGG